MNDRVQALALGTLSLLLAVSAAGCGPSAAEMRADVRPVDEDLLQLVPSGAELVVDLDGSDFRNWGPSSRLMALLPEAATATLRDAGMKLGDVDQMVIALGDIGADGAWQVALVRGDVDWPKAAPLFGGETQSDYRGVTLFEGARSAVLLTPRLFAVGQPTSIRRVVDLYRSESQSVRTAERDGNLRAALARVPSSKSGRAALVGGLLIDDGVRQALEAPSWAADFTWVSIAMAVGDGFDLELIAKTPGKAEAADDARHAAEALSALARRQLVRLLGLSQFLTPAKVVARDDETRMVLRLAGGTVDALMGHLEGLRAAADHNTTFTPAHTPQPLQLERPGQTP